MALPKARDMEPEGPGIAGELDVDVAGPSADPIPRPNRGAEQAEVDGQEGGGPKKETITKEWHEKRLRKEAQRRSRLEAENRRLRDEAKSYRDRESKASAEELLKDLGLPPEQAAVVGAMGKLTERILGRVEERLGKHAESVSELATEFKTERRRAMLRGLDPDQTDLVEAISEETGLKDPGELLALAMRRDPELFAGYEPEKGSMEASPARGALPQRRMGQQPTIDEAIAEVKAQIADPKNKSRIHRELGPKLMMLSRMKVGIER